MPQLVVVDHVLVSERDAEDALADQRGDAMLDPLRHPGIAEASGEAADQADRAVRRAERQRAGVRGDRPAVERRRHAAALDRCRIEQRRATLRRHREPLPHRRRALSKKNFHDSGPRCTYDW